MVGNYQNDKKLSVKIFNWVLESIGEVIITSNAVCVHIDNFINTSGFTRKDTIESSIELFDLFVKSFKETKSNGLHIYLSVELVEFGDRIKGAPNTFKNLCEEFDMFSMPEIILYKPTPILYPPQVEIYRKPLFFEEFMKYRAISFFYKEDRLANLGIENVEFRRELNAIYIPSEE